MEVVKFKYNETEIEFNPTGSDNIMVNATQMAKIFGKRVDVFIKTDHAKEFILIMELTPFGGSSTPLKREQIINSENGNGTYMHRVLALKFAAWLDPKFELWVYSTIDDILFGDLKKYKEANLRQIRLEQAYEQKKKELIENHPEMIEYLELEAQLKLSKYSRIKLSRENMNQMKLNFG